MIGQTISHYKILEKLGGGGMGVVYKAEDTKLKRLVALKFLPLDLTRDEEAKERFMHEAQAASALDHPNICVIHEIDETEDGQMFIVMAYYDGETLKKQVASGKLQVTEVIDIAIQVAQGLAKAHEHGITHRDIKPANIMVTNDGVAKIVDFGLAKLAGQAQLTKAGTTLGTAAYMSPEQARGEPTDHQTDIWALGVVLYEMLTGQVPFKGEYEQAMIYSILNETPEPVTRFHPEVPVELERITNKCLEKDPSRRYQRAEELIADLDQLRQALKSGGTGSGKAVSSPIPRRRFRTFVVPGLVALALILIAVGYFMLRSRPESSTTREIKWEKSIAVLPFADLSPQKDQEYFVDGLTDALITELSKIQALRVISRQSSMQFKGSTARLPEIGGKLKVNTVVEGTVLRAGDKVRINAQLIEASTDRHLWAETYDGDLRDILKLQSEVVQAIARGIKIAITPADKARMTVSRPVNPEAHEAYLKGRFFILKITEADIKQAIAYFEQALEKDPTYALAHAGLAEAYSLLTSLGWMAPENGRPIVTAEATKALELDYKLANAYVMLGDVAQLKWDWEEGIKYYRRAMKLNPGYAEAHHSYAVLLSFLGRHDEAIAEMKRALDLDPLALYLKWQAGVIFYYARRYDEAIEQYKEALHLDPNFSAAYASLGAAYLQKMRYEEAIQASQKAVELHSSFPVKLMLAYTYAVTGKTAPAKEILEEALKLSQQQYVSAYAVARVYAALDEKERAFDWLNKACQQQSSELAILKVDPRLDKLRPDPRFAELLKKVRLENDRTNHIQEAWSSPREIKKSKNESSFMQNQFLWLFDWRLNHAKIGIAQQIFLENWVFDDRPVQRHFLKGGFKCN